MENTSLVFVKFQISRLLFYHNQVFSQLIFTKEFMMLPLLYIRENYLGYTNVLNNKIQKSSKPHVSAVVKALKIN